MVDVGVNTDGGPLVHAVPPRGVNGGLLVPRVHGIMMGQGRGAAIRRILANLAHEQAGRVGGLADWD